MSEDLSPAQAERNKWRWQFRRQMAIAQHDYPAHTVLQGGQVLNVFTEELIEADVAIDAGRIVGVGDYPDGRSRIDVSGKVIAPSFIDAHIHLESSLLWPPEFARAVVPHGTGAIVTDPHEIANVAGLPGIEALRDASRDVPLTVNFTAPSCVPASEHEVPGARITPEDIATMLDWPEVVGLGEMMDYPGLIGADPDVAERIYVSRGHLRDGHAPMLTGLALQAYIASGIDFDHESVSLDEAREKLRLGLGIMLRQGSSQRNLVDLLPLVTDATVSRICFSSDDRDPHDLLHNGHIDDSLRTAIGAGLEPIRAIRMATWNPAQMWRLPEVGAVAPGYRANLVVLDDLESVAISAVWHQGRLVAEQGALTIELPEHHAPESLRNTVQLGALPTGHFDVAERDSGYAIRVNPGQITTELIELPVNTDGHDVQKAVLIERHRASGDIGAAWVQGFGLRRGAIASTIAHDAHNIVAVGANDSDIAVACRAVEASEGGLVAVEDGEIRAHLPLPIAGLLSDQPLAAVADAYAAVDAAAHTLGSTLESPFGQLAFLALSVIPEAKLTTDGLLRLSAAPTPGGSR